MSGELALTFVRSLDPADERRRLEGSKAAAGATAAMLLRVDDPPGPFGHSHVLVHEAPDAAGVFDAVEDALAPGTVVLGTAVLAPHGRWRQRVGPGAPVQGVVIGFAKPATVADEASWDEWYEETHVGDVLSTGGFDAATRWRLLDARRGEPAFATLYESVSSAPGAALDLVQRGMRPLVEAGRMHPAHVAGVRHELAVVATR